MLTIQTGSMVQFKQEYNPSKLKNLSGGKRGKIKGFSWKASKNFCSKLAAINHEETVRRHGGCSWITLTFDGNETGADNCKAKLDYLLDKVLPRAGWTGPKIWKAELQKRGTVHFHILAYDKWSRKLHDFVRLRWHEITGSQQEKHLEHGGEAKRVTSVKMLRCYLAKYLTKEEGDGKTEWNLGKVWGIYGRAKLVMHEAKEILWDSPLGKVQKILKHLEIHLPPVVYDINEYLQYGDEMMQRELWERMSYWQWRRLQRLDRKKRSKLAEKTTKNPPDQSVSSRTQNFRLHPF